MTEINPLVWFGQRQLPFVPKHFVKAPTPVTTQSLFWIKTKLTGRYSYQPAYDKSIIFNECYYIYFEDPMEVTVYELRWAGVNNF